MTTAKASETATPETFTELEEHLSNAVREIQAAQRIMASYTTTTPMTPPDWEEDRLKLWYLLEKKGGVVSRDELYAIADKLGYDHRGLGGFFVGRDASLIWVAGEKVALKDAAAQEVETYREWLDKHLK